MLQHAFKEWAVICKALAEGRQAIILRKGGIAEEGETFRLEHKQFWLFLTYLHQQETGITPEAHALLNQAKAERPPDGVVRLSHFAEVAGIYQLHDIVGTMKLAGLHLWSEETVQARFTYRTPGLFVLPVRIYRAAKVHEIPDTSHYAGCKSWVELDRPLPTANAMPVLDDSAFRDVLRTLDVMLNPTAFA